MLQVDRQAFVALVAEAYDRYPEEACGLLGGLPDRSIARSFHACRNLTTSARVYTIDPKDHLRADREAEAAGLELIGVVHSHTHTEPFPSPTDVAQAPDPSWHYVIVSLKREAPEVRSFRIVDGRVTEEPIAIL